MFAKCVCKLSLQVQFSVYGCLVSGLVVYRCLGQRVCSYMDVWGNGFAVKGVWDSGSTSFLSWVLGSVAQNMAAVDVFSKMGCFGLKVMGPVCIYFIFFL